jgi:hypothetical protein
VVKFGRYDAAADINERIERAQGVADLLVALDLRSNDEEGVILEGLDR